ncbi:MAG: hypothetical protein WBB44_01390 [Candidatus Nanopelagicales bacterium]|nr:hypothetical protein [Candidatus Nanopelagicales bacterium]
MTSSDAITDSDFFEGFARYKLMELTYRLALPDGGQPGLTPKRADLAKRQASSSNLTYETPDPTKTWEGLSDVVAAQAEMIRSQNRELMLTRRELRQTSNRLANAHANNTALKEKLERAQESRKRIATELGSMKRRRSWRITKPLRKARGD